MAVEQGAEGVEFADAPFGGGGQVGLDDGEVGEPWGAPKLPDSPSIRMDVWKGEVIASTEEELLSGIQR
jgi:hypothetical protein